MIKYILHGGRAQDPNNLNDKFFSEILEDLPDKTSVLLVHFASEPEKHEKNKLKDISQFDRVKGNRKISFEIANEEDFQEQIKNSDIIYFSGGTTKRLLETLKKFPDLKNWLDGKIVAGESAGANVFAVLCYSKAGGRVMECLGFIPIKTIPHFTGEHIEELNNVKKDLETVPLKEFEYRVFDSN